MASDRRTSELKDNAAALNSKLQGMVVGEVVSDGIGLQIKLIDQFGSEHILAIEHQYGIGVYGPNSKTLVKLNEEDVFYT